MQGDNNNDGNKQEGGEQKKPVPVPNLANFKTFDIGGGRTATVRCAGDFTRGKLAQYAGYRNGDSDTIELRQAALKWGVQSVACADGTAVLGRDNKPVTRVNQGPLLGHAYTDALFDTIDQAINDEMFAHVMAGAVVSDDEKKA